MLSNRIVLSSAGNEIEWVASLCVRLSLCAVQVSCISEHQQQFGSHNLTVNQICGTAALEASELNQLQEIAKLGITFAGDSSVRRLYVRTVLHLQGPTNEAVAEMIQTNSFSSQQLQVLNFTILDGDIPNHYTSNYTIVRYIPTKSGYFDHQWTSTLTSSSGLIFCGMPFLGLLYLPGRSSALCDPSFDFRDSILKLLVNLQQTAKRLDTRIVIGTAPMLSRQEDKSRSAAVAHPEQAAQRVAEVTDRLKANSSAECRSCWHERRCNVRSVANCRM